MFIIDIPRNEQQWLTCDHVNLLIHFLWDQYLARRKVSKRRLRLFAAACCQRIGHLFPDENCRAAVEVAERYADGLADKQELAAARKSVRFSRRDSSIAHHAKQAAQNATKSSDMEAVLTLDVCVASALAEERSGRDEGEFFENERDKLAPLLRHIFPNPFRPDVQPPQLPSCVTRLASALYAGEDCSFALHDALLESGHPGLAEHFRDPNDWHPKGCWALDLILGKS